jgi:hypothetical protein
VAVARADDGATYFAVQMFGRPKSMTVQFKVTNQSDQTVRYTVAAKQAEQKNGRSFVLEPRMTRIHERCRTPLVEFQQGQEQTLTPISGTWYVVQQSDAGDLKIVKKSE